MYSMPVLTIISYNIFWGQGPGFSSLPPPDNPDPAIRNKLVELYNRKQPDILCLQEVQNREGAADLADRIKKRVVFCAGREIVYYGGGIFSSPFYY